ncbi:CRISPR-associated protein Csx14 [Thermoflexus hugenholtzii]
MTKKLLVATLGTSPAVITEAVDLLAEEGERPDGLLLFHTEDPDVKESLELLEEHLPKHCGISWVVPIQIGSYGDVDSTEAAVEFMEQACAQLRAYRDEHRLFVCIAGGRKVMSALLALAVQFYGAERLFHIWAPPWLEAEGEIAELRKFRDWPEQLTKRLHPPLNQPPTDRPRLVDLPFISLFPMLPAILDALGGHASASKEIKQLLVRAGLLNPDDVPTPIGQRVAAILSLVEMLPPARSQEPHVHIPHHHHRDRLERFAWDLIGYAPFVVEVRGEEWRKGQFGVEAEPPSALIVRVRLGTDIPFRLRLITTATTEGQLEAARRYIERYVHRREG